jgi:hypothetical protein
MRPTTKPIAYLTRCFAVCIVLLSGSTRVYSQGSSRSPRTRYEDSLAGNNSPDPLSPVVDMSSQPSHTSRSSPRTETVSVQALLLPSGAVKEFERSMKAVHSGDFPSAVDHLQKAIRIQPDFVQAHNNLGASYLQLSQYERAVSEFQLSIALDPQLAETHRNLGLGLFLLRRYPDAELATRQALGLDPRRSTAKYTLGRILAAEGSGSGEAEQLLRESLAEFPEARLPLAQVLLNKGSRDQATTELQIYLNSPDAGPAMRHAVQCWIAKIKGTT